MNRILIVEDEAHIANGLQFNLEAEGCEARVAESAEAALEVLGEGFDLIVLDIMLPGMSGFELASKLRQRGDYTPILMLTARGRAEDVVRGFESGADDYLPKPFELNVLLARVRGLLRRAVWTRKSVVAEAAPVAEPQPLPVIGGRRIDLENLEVRSPQGVLRLTLMEAELLGYFLRNAGRAVSRKEILLNVWDLRDDTDTRAVDNFVVRLRKYLEDDPSRPQRLLTVRGVGYRLVGDEPASEEEEK